MMSSSPTSKGGCDGYGSFLLHPSLLPPLSFSFSMIHLQKITNKQSTRKLKVIWLVSSSIFSGSEIFLYFNRNPGGNSKRKNEMAQTSLVKHIFCLSLKVGYTNTQTTFCSARQRGVSKHVLVES